MRNNYLLFCGQKYYPKGGIEDLMYIGDSISSCQKYFISNIAEITDQYDDGWCHIFNMETMKIEIFGLAIRNKEDKIEFSWSEIPHYYNEGDNLLFESLFKPQDTKEM